MRHTIANLLITICLAALTFPLVLLATDLDDLKTVPPDEDEAWNVRIWLGIERSSRCLTAVTVINTQRDTVRHLFSTMMGKGYYNFYWDKRDDSGQFVDTGRYQYVIDDCDGIRIGGKLKVTYKQYERTVWMVSEGTEKQPIIHLVIALDSVPLSLSVEREYGAPVDSLFTDSLFRRGDYRIAWPTAEDIRGGRYLARLRAGDYETTTLLRFRR